MTKMTGYQLFKHAILRVYRNIDDALAISGLLWVGAMVAVVLLTGFDETPEAASASPSLAMGQIFKSLIANVIIFLVSVWIAVEWHRFALLGERPQTMIPPLRLPLLAPYLGKSLLLGGIMIGIMVLFSAVISVMSAVVGPLMMIAFVFVGVFVYYVFLRFSSILPHAALGQTLGLSDAWEESGPVQSTLLQAAILSVLATCALQLLTFVGGSGIIGLIISLFLGWVMLIVNVSLLSSIYELVERKL
jgi:hypothetical protein